MVRQRRNAVVAEKFGGLLDLFARQAVDDAGVAVVVVLDEAQELVSAVALLIDRVANVRAVEAADVLRRGVQVELLRDFRACNASAVAVNAIRGTSGKRSCRIFSAVVLGAEVVAPLRHAVRLVDREQC